MIVIIMQIIAVTYCIAYFFFVLLIVCWHFTWCVLFNPQTFHFTDKEIGFKRECASSKLIQTS